MVFMTAWVISTILSEIFLENTLRIVLSLRRNIIGAPFVRFCTYPFRQIQSSSQRTGTILLREGPIWTGFAEMDELDAR